MKKVIKVAISGSRNITDKSFVYSVLDFYLSRLLIEEYIVVIHGGAEGVDFLCDKWAKEKMLETLVFKPEYDKFPPKIAPIKRNQQIVDEADCLIAITTGSNGTASTIKMAEKKGIPIKVVKYEN